jgi:hypothetical protein
MAKNQPLWLQLVHRLERAIGEPVESAVRSDAYFDFVAQANRARARLTELTESLTRDWLHLWNLPTATDIRGVREQLARVERRLNDVAKEFAGLEEASAKEARQTRSNSRPARAKPRQTRPK